MVPGSTGESYCKITGFWMIPASSRLSPAAARSTPVRSELGTALASCRGAFISIGLVSGLSNVLMLTGAVFMLEIYDRVLPSRSVPTLVGIAILAGGLYVVQGILDLIRSRLLVRVGSALDEAGCGRVFDTILRLPIEGGKVN